MNNREKVYLVLVVLGATSTWYFNIQFMMTHGTGIGDFIRALMLNDASRSISVDIALAGTAFLFWSFHESQNLKMKNWWAYLLVSVFIAFAAGAPLFLLMRERALKSRG